MKKAWTYDDYIWLGGEQARPERSVLDPVWFVMRLMLASVLLVGLTLVFFAICTALGYLWLRTYVGH